MSGYFNQVSEGLWEKINFGECLQSQLNHTWFMVRYLATHELVKTVRLHEAKFRKEFRDALDISALRLAKLVISFGQEEIDVRVKLAQPSSPERFFRARADHKLIKSTVGLITKSLSRCLRTCLLEQEFCVAATYHIQGMCELLIDEKQAKLARKYGDYKVQANTEKQSLFTAYYREYFKPIDSCEFDNQAFLKNLQKRIDEKNFAFYLSISLGTLTQMRPAQLVLNSGDGRIGNI